MEDNILDNFEMIRYLRSMKPLSAENQKLLLDFLLTILADTTSLKVKCLSSHHNKYLEIVDKFDELGLQSISEDSSIGVTGYDIVIDFKGLIGSLIDFSKIKFEVGEDND